MAASIIPRVERVRLYFQTADVLVPTFIRAAGGWSAPEAHRLDAVESVQPELRTQCPRRRCDDCQLNLTRDVLHALGNCPRWGKRRHGVETRCSAFVAKDGAR
jgi:hypothetical protein